MRLAVSRKTDQNLGLKIENFKPLVVKKGNRKNFSSYDLSFRKCQDLLLRLLCVLSRVQCGYDRYTLCPQASLDSRPESLLYYPFLHPEIAL